MQQFWRDSTKTRAPCTYTLCIQHTWEAKLLHLSTEPNFKHTRRILCCLYGFDDDIINEAVFHEYIDWTKADDPAADLFRSAVDFGSDFHFICPMDKIIRAHDEAGDRVYKYYFTHEVVST